MDETRQLIYSSFKKKILDRSLQTAEPIKKSNGYTSMYDKKLSKIILLKILFYFKDGKYDIAINIYKMQLLFIYKFLMLRTSWEENKERMGSRMSREKI